MTPEQFRQVEDLFHRGKDMSQAQQRALLDADCADDPEARAKRKSPQRWRADRAASAALIFANLEERFTARRT